MSYQRKFENRKRLKKTYCSTKTKCSGGVYYDARKGRYVRYYLYKRGNCRHIYKRLSNKRVRKSTYINNGAGYKRIYDYWWEIL